MAVTDSDSESPREQEIAAEASSPRACGQATRGARGHGSGWTQPRPCVQSSVLGLWSGGGPGGEPSFSVLLDMHAVVSAMPGLVPGTNRGVSQPSPHLSDLKA